jgi:hypothetical protein
LPTCIYQIRLPEEQDAEAFAEFMRKEYLPAIEPREPTRGGRVTDLTLLQRLSDASQESGADNAPEFVLHVDWEGVLGCRDSWVADQEVLRKLESFGASVKLLGNYFEHIEVEDYEG